MYIIGRMTISPLRTTGRSSMRWRPSTADCGGLMIGVLSSQGALNGMSPTDLARDAVEMANAMMSVREERCGS